MNTLQIRNMPKEIYDGIKQAAEESRRSMTQEVINILATYLVDKQNQHNALKRKESALARLKQIKQLKVYDTTDIVSMVREDRDR